MQSNCNYEIFYYFKPVSATNAKMIVRLLCAIFGVVFAFVLLLQADAVAAPPDWFLKGKPSNAQDYEYYGFGEGSTLKEATEYAKEAIAGEIRSDVVSKIDLAKKVENDKFTQRVEQDLTVKSAADLTDVELIKKDEAEGKWYVGVKYENITTSKKCAKRIKPLSIGREKQNRYLSKTLLIQEINKESGCSPALCLVRKDSVWYLTHEKIDKLFPLTATDFNKLFAPYSSSHITLSVSNENPTEGTAISFEVGAKQDGFITLFDVYENGQVFIVATHQVKTKTTLTIPDMNAEDELVAGLLVPGKPASDLYVAVFTKEKPNFTRIQPVGQQLDKDDEHYKFDELVKLLDDHEFSSRIVRTRPKPTR